MRKRQTDVIWYAHRDWNDEPVASKVEHSSLLWIEEKPSPLIPLHGSSISELIKAHHILSVFVSSSYRFISFPFGTNFHSIRLNSSHPNDYFLVSADPPIGSNRKIMNYRIRNETNEMTWNELISASEIKAKKKEGGKNPNKCGESI